MLVLQATVSQGLEAKIANSSCSLDSCQARLRIEMEENSKSVIRMT